MTRKKKKQITKKKITLLTTIRGENNGQRSAWAVRSPLGVCLPRPVANYNASHNARYKENYKRLQFSSRLGTAAVAVAVLAGAVLLLHALAMLYRKGCRGMPGLTKQDRRYRTVSDSLQLLHDYHFHFLPAGTAAISKPKIILPRVGLVGCTLRGHPGRGTSAGIYPATYRSTTKTSRSNDHMPLCTNQWYILSITKSAKHTKKKTSAVP